MTLGVPMKKLVIALAALAVIGLALSPAVVSEAQAQAKGKKLWEGWFEELRKVNAPVPPPAPAKKK
jgi:hypothetical protein